MKYAICYCYMPFDEIRYCYFPFADEEMQPRETKCYVEGHTSWSVAEFKPRQADSNVSTGQLARLPGEAASPGTFLSILPLTYPVGTLFVTFRQLCTPSTAASWPQRQESSVQPATAMAPWGSETPGCLQEKARYSTIQQEPPDPGGKRSGQLVLWFHVDLRMD